MEDLELGRSLDKERLKTPTYAEVLTEIKRRSLEENDFSSLAPMRTGLHPTAVTETRATSRANKTKPDHNFLSPSAINERTQKSLDEGSRRLKAIEDHMWQHRQEERDLKRAEADIHRQQKQMEKTIKEYKNKISKAKSEESQNFHDKEATFTDFYNADLHAREKLTKDKIQHSSTSKQRMNEETKHFMRSTNELNYRYKQLMETLEMKRSEVEKLSTDFETRLREKEDEQHEVKKKLASLAIKINMEAQKRRHHVAETRKEKTRAAIKDTIESNLRDTEVIQKQSAFHHAGASHEHQRIKLDRSAHSKEETIRTKQVQEGRNLADVITQAKIKSEQQRFAQQEAEFVRLDMLNEEIQKDVDIANAKRKNRLDTLQQQVKVRNATKYETWAQRAVALENEAKKRERQERVKKLSKTVAHQDELEHSLYSTAKNAESLRKKQTQTVEKLNIDLKSLKLQNARKLKEAAIEAQSTERQLQLKISRELSELSKAVNTREESLRSLTVQKARAREERRMLEEERKEYGRKSKISKQTAHSSSVI